MISQLFRKIVRVFWLLPGFLLWASFPPMCERLDVCFALAPLLYLARRGEARRSAKTWAANGLFFWVATLSWMPAITANGGPWPLVLLGWFGLAAYCTLYFAAFGFLCARYWRWTQALSRPAARRTGHFLGLLLVEPVLWSGLELVRSRFLGGFSWNPLGVAPVNAGFGAPAAWGGVYLVSALVILVNGTLASIADRFISSWRRCESAVLPRALRSLETVLPFALVFAIYAGASSRPQPSAGDRPPTATLSVALVQRNFPCCFQTKAENPIVVYSNLLAHVSALRPDLVVLSESALSEFGSVDSRRAGLFVEGLMNLAGAQSVLAGGGRADAEGRFYNSAGLFTARTLALYDKVHLVPFGEFIPCDKIFPILQKLAPVGSCTPGEPKLLHLSLEAVAKPPSPVDAFVSNASDKAALPLGVAICFEDTDSALLRSYARMGARLLVFITNDSWFAHSHEAVQHAEQAVARAIETGLPVLRVGNSGVTGLILPDGRASWLCGADGRPLVDARGTFFDRVPLPESPARPVSGARPSATTPYVAFGDAPLALAFGLLLLTMIMVKYLPYGKH